MAEEITTCPSCGSAILGGRKYIDDYRIVDVLHEGHSSFLCRAIRERTQELIMIRLFTPESGVDEQVAGRLKRELEQIREKAVAGKWAEAMKTADEKLAQKTLEKFGVRIRTPWFLDIHDYLRGKLTEQTLKEKAGEAPEKLVTAYTFMGFWEEGSGRPDIAIKHYKEALESFLDDWLEYDFAREQIKMLKKAASDDK